MLSFHVNLAAFNMQSTIQASSSNISVKDDGVKTAISDTSKYPNQQMLYTSQETPLFYNEMYQNVANNMKISDFEEIVNKSNSRHNLAFGFVIAAWVFSILSIIVFIIHVIRDKKITAITFTFLGIIVVLAVLSIINHIYFAKQLKNKAESLYDSAKNLANIITKTNIAFDAQSYNSSVKNKDGLLVFNTHNINLQGDIKNGIWTGIIDGLTPLLKGDSIMSTAVIKSVSNLNFYVFIPNGIKIYSGVSLLSGSKIQFQSDTRIRYKKSTDTEVQSHVVPGGEMFTIPEMKESNGDWVIFVDEKNGDKNSTNGMYYMTTGEKSLIKLQTEILKKQADIVKLENTDETDDTPTIIMNKT